MAEAHQGVAFSFSVTEDDGLNLNVSREALKAVLRSGMRNWRKTLSRFANHVLNGVYPSHPARGILLIGLVTALKRYKNIDLSFGIIEFIKGKIPITWGRDSNAAELITCTAVGTGFWIIQVAFRRFTLQFLYSYNGWMYEGQSKGSLKTKIWAGLVKLFIGHKPKLFSYQQTLPYLPVPPLNDTINRYLLSVRPLLEEDNYARIEASARDFQKTLGKRLQRYLILKSWISSNYVSDWWEEYVYLRGRSPIMVNSNFYGLESVTNTLTKFQAARAANIIHAAFLYRRELDNETLTPIMLQDLVPLCSRQYERQFNTTRIPGEITDKLVHLNDSKHIAVYSNGKWYKLSVYCQSQLLNPKELEIQIQKILDDKTEVKDGERYLAALTAGDRIPWAQTRKKFFSEGINKKSLDAIEKAAFVLILDEEECHPQSNEERQLDLYGRSLLHGKGYDRWFDKSFNLIVYRNGRMGINSEHSWADAPITGHLWEYIIGEDALKLGYDSNGHTKGTIRFNLPDPNKLRWDITPECFEKIQSSLDVAVKLLNDVDLHIYVLDLFGKNVAKKCKVSPDAFIQMSLQLAYFRDIGQLNLTYESSMTRLYREGRTETVRSCSIESSNWVKAMNDPKVTAEERLALLRKACEHHQLAYRDAMTGKGIDRHIFCLYVISKYLEVDSPFLKEVLSEPWRLSTSQTPSNQTSKVDFKKNPELISAGGGFGPVADDGYGVSYIVMGEDRIFFHISSKKSSEKTDSYRFGQEIRKALIDTKEVFEKIKSIENEKK